MSSMKILDLIGKYICDEWCPQIARYKKEREFVQRDIVELLRFYKAKMFYKFGPVGKILVNVNGKCYVVDFMQDNIYIDKKQHSVPYDYPINLIEEESIYYFPYEATLYKNYTNNYEDIKIIFKTIDQYLTDQQQQIIKNPWNVEQKIKEVFGYIIEAEKAYRSRSLNYISSSQDSCLFLNSNNISDCNNNYYEQLKFDVIDIFDTYFLHKSDFFKFCNDILVLNKNLYNRNEDNYFYIKFAYITLFPSYNNSMYIMLRKITSFLKNFDINKKILSMINSEKRIKNYYEDISYLHPNEQKQEIEKLFKKVDPELLNLVNTRLQQSDYNYRKFKNSLYFNFSETDVIKLFYNPRIFYILLPENLSVRKYRVSMYVINCMFNTRDIKNRTINIQDIDDVKNIDNKKALSYVKIKFCLNDPYNSNKKFTFSLPLDIYLFYLFELNRVNDIFRFIRCDDYDYLFNPDYNTRTEIESLRKDLSSFIAANKFLLLQLILNKMEDHINMGKIYTEPSKTKVSEILDTILVTYAENYFDNYIKF